MTEQEITTDIQWLYSNLSARDARFLREYNRFMSNGMRNQGIREIYTWPSGFFNGRVDQDTGQLPAINVGRSIALTLRSKLIQTKGRIFFSPVNGLWNTIKVCRNAQIYFDAMIERDNLNNKVKQCVLDGLRFGYGPIWIDDETKATYRLKPWEFYVDPAEFNYGKVSRCMIMFENYPLVSLEDRLPKNGPSFKKLQDNRNAKVKIYHYFDLKGGYRHLVVNSEFLPPVKINYTRMPVALFYYEDPVKGLDSSSVMTNVYPNQWQIDSILYRIHDAFELSPANTIYIPESEGDTNGSVDKMMSNKVGNTMKYKAQLGLPIVVTPPAIDQQYFEALKFFMETTYEQEGVSMLSAQSKKPSGVTASVALETLQDVESERFQAQVDNLIQFYKDIYQIMIDVFPEADDILPARVNRAKIKWSEIKKQRDSFSLSSSLTSMLSKEPKARMEQVQQLQNMGVINPNMAAQLMQFPDIEGAFSAAAASYDNCLKIIERAIDKNEFVFSGAVNFKQLLEESVNTLLQLDSVDEKPEILASLEQLIKVVMEKLNGAAQITSQSNQPPQPNMDGREMTAMLDIMKAVKMGEISQDQADAALSAAFPNQNPDLLAKVAGLAPALQDQSVVPPPVDQPVPESMPPTESLV